MAEVVDLESLFPGVTTLEKFPEELAKIDFSKFEGKHVQLKGCLPSWAHLLVAGKLFGRASQVDFLVDDGKTGIPVPIYKK